MAADTAPGPVLAGRYRLVAPLGEGAVGMVFRARDLHSARDVAIKRFRGSPGDPALADAIEHEVRAQAGLDHPGIVPVLDYHRGGGASATDGADGPFLVTELAPLGSLNSRRGRLDWATLRDVLLRVLEPLGYAHAEGLIHRDLKPANVVLDDAGLPRLTDFGLAYALDLLPGESGDSRACGTPAYMAPEQFAGDWRNYGPATDLYAVGCLGWDLATGRPPFGDDLRFEMAAAAHWYWELPEPRFATEVPAGLLSWLSRLLEKSAGDRFVSAAEAARALASLPDRPDGVPSPSAVPSPSTWPLALPPSAERAVDAGATHSTGSPASLNLFGLRAIPFVDREAERDALWTGLRRAVESGRPVLRLLAGAAGVGKSRLARWVCHQAHRAGAVAVLRASHGPVPGAELGLRGMLVRLLRCGGLSGQELDDQVTAALGALGLAGSETAEEMVALLEPRDGDRAGVRSSPKERHRAIARLLARIATRGPVAVWLDDAHHDPDALEFARDLALDPGCPPASVLLVLTSRDEDRVRSPAADTAWRELAALPGAEEIGIGPLEDEHLGGLVRRVLPLDPSLAARVDQVTAGNPLFAIHLLDDWVRRGLVAPGPRGHVVAPGAAVTLPEDLDALWKRRVDEIEGHLSPPEIAALEIAAALGTDVDAGLWRAVCATLAADASGRLLSRLLHARLATCGPEGPDRQWSFVHSLLRQAVCHRAEEAGRAAGQHRACAAEITRRGGPGSAEASGLHLVSAGEGLAALDPLLKGANERLLAGEYPQAEALLADRERVMVSLPLPDDDPRWGDGWLARSLWARSLGRYEDQEAWTRRTREAAERHGWRRHLALAIRGQSFQAFLKGEAERAEALLLEAEEAARDLPDPEVRAVCQLDRGNLLMRVGDLDRAAEALEEARRAYQARGNFRGALSCGMTLAKCRESRGLFAEARAMFEEYGRAFAERGMQWGVALAQIELGGLAWRRGEAEDAERLWADSLALRTRLGMPTGWLHLVMALAREADGRPADARALLVDRSEESWSGTDEGWRFIAHSVLASCAAQEGDLGAFDHHLDAVLSALEKHGYATSWSAEALRRAGTRLERAGDAARARPALEAAERQFRTLGWRGDEGE